MRLHLRYHNFRLRKSSRSAAKQAMVMLLVAGAWVTATAMVTERYTLTDKCRLAIHTAALA